MDLIGCLPSVSPPVVAGQLEESSVYPSAVEEHEKLLNILMAVGTKLRGRDPPLYRVLLRIHHDGLLRGAYSAAPHRFVGISSDVVWGATLSCRELLEGQLSLYRYAGHSPRGVNFTIMFSCRALYRHVRSSSRGGGYTVEFSVWRIFVFFFCEPLRTIDSWWVARS